MPLMKTLFNRYVRFGKGIIGGGGNDFKSCMSYI